MLFLLLIFVRRVLTYRQVLHLAQELVLQLSRGVQQQRLLPSHTAPLLYNHNPLRKVVFIIIHFTTNHKPHTTHHTTL